MKRKPDVEKTYLQNKAIKQGKVLTGNMYKKIKYEKTDHDNDNHSGDDEVSDMDLNVVRREPNTKKVIILFMIEVSKTFILFSYSYSYLV